MRKEIRILIRKIWKFTRKHISRKNENLPFYILIFLSFIVFALALNFFVELTDGLRGLKGFDRSVTDFFLSYRSEALTEFFIIITDIGDLNGYLVAMALVAIYFRIKFRHWKFILQLFAVVVLSAFSNRILKRFIDRARPGIEHLVVVETLSYPSGHAMCAMAFYGFLTYLTFHIKMSGILRFILSTLFISLILLIGISRIYLGVHFPTDVLGGFIAGLIWVTFCIFLFNVISLYTRMTGKTTIEEEEVNIEE